MYSFKLVVKEFNNIKTSKIIIITFVIQKHMVHIYGYILLDCLRRWNNGLFQVRSGRSVLKTDSLKKG
jgi:hypothetical protein